VISTYFGRFLILKFRQNCRFKNTILRYCFCLSRCGLV
jgi:hypothetical protein